jgi:O-antigen/teichoic acid export membrane protein
MPKSESNRASRFDFSILTRHHGRPAPAWILGVGGSVILSAVARAIGLVNAVLLARLLQPAGYGLYSYAFAVATALAIPSQFGIPTVVTREVAAGDGLGRWDLARGAIKWAYAGIALCSTVVLVFASAVLVFRGSDLTEFEITTYAVAMTLIPLFALDELRIAVLAGLRYIVLSRLPGEILRSLIVLCGLLVISAVAPSSFFNATNAMALLALAAGSSYIISSFILHRVRPVELKEAKPTYSIRCWNRSALPIALTTGIGFLNQSASLLIVGSFLSYSDVGHYRVAILGSGLVVLGLGAVNNALAPYYARFSAQSDHVSLQRFTTRSAQIALLVAMPLTAIYAAIGGVLIEKFFGNGYASAYWPLVILAVGQLFIAATGSVGMILYMSHHERDASLGAATGAGVNVAASLLLVPHFGIIGAAYATAASEVVWGIMWCWLVWRRLGIIPGPVSLR